MDNIQQIPIRGNHGTYKQENNTKEGRVKDTSHKRKVLDISV